MFDALNGHFGDDVEWGIVAYPPFIINNPQRVIYYQQNAVILIIKNLLRFSLRRDTAIDSSCLLVKLIIIRQSKSFFKLEY